MLKTPFAIHLFPHLAELRLLFNTTAGKQFIKYLRACKYIDLDTIIAKAITRDSEGHVTQDNTEQIRGRVKLLEGLIDLPLLINNEVAMQEYRNQYNQAKQEREPQAGPDTYTELG